MNVPATFDVLLVSEVGSLAIALSIPFSHSHFIEPFGQLVHDGNFELPLHQYSLVIFGG